ncbi:MAG TPA: AraC family transcriptional regulator [Acidobacteriota bacterium]|nr:AraC family transcriptional regulator [Acidobacteriota bacterium]HND20866.1 AraC family transcriptional regulator [Acidobacteriota bacterium]
MNPTTSREHITVWHPSDLPQVEVRRGFSVARTIPRHWHDEYQLCLIQSGTGELQYRGATLLTPPASLFIIHPGEVHANRALAATGCSYRTLFLTIHQMHQVAQELQGTATPLPFFPSPIVVESHLLDCFERTHLALEATTSSLERQTRLLNLITQLIVQVSDSRPELHPTGSDRKILRHACDYLVEHFAENILLEELASLSNLSPFHFNRMFSLHFGMPPHAFQTQLRVMRAQALLRQGWSIPQVASQTGFADQSHLNRHFKRVTGLTPGQYRQNRKNVQDSLTHIL